jgi:long-subunit fatty acid transport protein
LAYVFGGNGLLSADFGVKDFRNTSFRPRDSFFNPINSQLSDLLVMAAEIRVGGEYKIKRLSLRGGYRYEQSPYKNGRTVGDLTGYSGGLGYNFGSTKLDLAYSYFQRAYDLQSFNVGLTDAARINNIQNTVTLSLLFDL